MTTALAVAVAATAVVSYWAGRVRLGCRLDQWADGKVGGPHGPGWWVAQVVMAVEIGWLFTTHPRRTAARLRESREFTRAPAPQFDSNWLAGRRTTPPPKDAP